ncbi:MAG: hypothetical protein AB4038_13210 [Prochloraceae cyanobacterium]
MDFPELEPIPMRREDEPGYEKEIWQPDWSCFCCRDTGIAINAARLVIKGWKLDSHKIPVCQEDGCQAGEKLANHPERQVQASLDWRLNAPLCRQVDELERSSWREWVKQRQQSHLTNNKVIDYSAAVKSLRSRPRSSEEEHLAQRKHAEARNK